MVLAAGAGTRLRPLTRLRPKPLCPVANVPMVDHAIARASTATDAIAVNVHHGRDAIEQHLAGRVHLSFEVEQALGTGGAVGHLRDWIDGRAAVVLNADTWCAEPLDVLLKGWSGDITRVLVAGDDELRPTSRIAGAVMPWRDITPLTAEPSGLYEASWRELAETGRLEVVRTDALCIDCGTPRSYLEANIAASGTDVVIGPGAVVAGEVVRGVVWPGGIVREGERLVDAIRAGSDVTVLVR